MSFKQSSIQSDIAFKHYKSIADDKNIDYFLGGHSLGGRLVQDVLYKIYDSNEGFLGTFGKTDITPPIHSATFNGLGYNCKVYAKLKNDILEQCGDKLHNYYFMGDLVGNSLGANPVGVFKTLGQQIPFIAKEENGEIIPVNKYIYEYVKVHSIKLWHCNPEFRYPNLTLFF